LRPGAVSIDRIRDVVGSGRIASEADRLDSSPGTRYRHYAPDAEVLLVKDPSLIRSPSESDAWIGLDPVPSTVKLLMDKPCVDVHEYARVLFEFFRQCDRKGVRRIWCQTVPLAGIGIALMDRLNRAARR
ncbi:MAG: threonylcarbamoyl-AMP synthase, partial [Rhodothermales bacterium]|nr:threonylcarbamoyl-AMP synthase [Rhodothermales bacterium]